MDEIQKENGKELKATTLWKCKVDIKRWPNSSCDHSEPLIAEEYLKEIDDSITKAVTGYYALTIPVPFAEYRLFSISLVFNSDIRRLSDSAETGINRAISHLRDQWPGILDEARNRLGDLFSEKEYPKIEEISELFGISFFLMKMGDVGDTISTSVALDKFSIFYREPSVPDIFEAKKWIEQMEKEKTRPK